MHGLWKGATTNFYQGTVDAIMATIDDSATSGPTSQHVPASTPSKHEPAVVHATSNVDGTVSVKVVVRGTDGSDHSLHPMSNAHFITHIWLTDQDGNVAFLREFEAPAADATDLPQPIYEFTIPAGSGITSLKPWEFCNLHGVWEGPSVPVPFSSRHSALVAATSTSGSGPSSLHEAGSTPVKHDPVVTSATANADGTTTVTVVVAGTDGSTADGSLHPMGNAHFIETIYLLDQNDRVVAMAHFDAPSDTYTPPASATFTVPADVTSVTP